MAYVDSFKIAGQSSITWNGTAYWPVTAWVKDGTGVGGDTRLQAAVRFLMSADSAINSNHIIAQYGWYTATGAVPPWSGSGYNQYMCIRRLNSAITSFLNEAGVMQAGDFFSTLDKNQRQGYWNDGVVDSDYMVWVNRPYIVTDCGTKAGGVSVSSKTFYLGQSDGPLSQVHISSSYTTPYVVAFSANGGTGTISSVAAKGSTSITLPSSGVTRTGYTFGGWNTKADKSGQHYAGGASYTVNANATLYAEWTALTYTVTYKANGGTGSDLTDTKTYGVNLTLKSSGFTKAGHSLSSWNTKADGTGTSYALGGTYSANANATLYAVWTPDTYTMTYKANGGTGSDVTQTKTYGVTAIVKSNPFTRTNYTFTGWNTASGGTGTAYAAGANYTANSAVTLWAQWLLNHAAPAFSNTPSIQRCTSSGTVSSSGTNVRIAFSYTKDSSITGVISTSSSTNCIKVTAQRSTDGGSTWSNMTLTTDTATTSKFVGHTTNNGFAITTAYLIKVTLTDTTTGTTYTAKYQGAIAVVAALLDMYSDSSVALGAVAPESVPSGWTGITTLGPKWDFQMDTNGGNTYDTALLSAYPSAINNAGVVSLKKALAAANDLSAQIGTLPIANGGTGKTTEYGAWKALSNGVTAHPSASATAGWYCVAEGTLTSGNDCEIVWLVTEPKMTSGASHVGILHMHVRYANGTLTVYTLEWLVAAHAGLNPADYVLTDDGSGTWKLHVYQTGGAYTRQFLKMLSQNRLGSLGGADITIYQDPTVETGTPSGTESTPPLMTGNTSWFGTCSTAAGTAAKEVTCAGFVLATGAHIAVYASSSNTVTGAITLNVNGTGAYPVYVQNQAASTSHSATWFASAYLDFVFDGAAWHLINDSTLACRSFYSRQTSPNIQPAGTAGIRHLLATSTMTTAKPYGDGHIIHCDWDSSAGWSSQLTLPTYTGNPVQWRGHTAANTWGAWETLDSVTEITGGTTMSTCRSSGGWGWRADKHSDGRMTLHVWNRYTLSATTSYQTLNLPASSALAVFTDFPIIHVTAVSTTTTNDSIATSVNSATMSTSGTQGSLSIGVRRTNGDSTVVINATLEGHWR